MEKLGRKTGIIAVLVLILVCIILFAIYYPVIFQRGNPVPYLKAASELSDETHFSVVAADDEADMVFISRKTAQDEFLSYVEESTGAEFLEQAGSGFIFKKDNESFVVENEIYLGRYFVWEVPVEAVIQK